MAKSSISPMDIIDVVDFIWGGKPTTYYVIQYRDKTYRKYSSHWVLVYPDGETGGYGSVDINFTLHLNRAWNYHYSGKIIKKTTKIIIE